MAWKRAENVGARLRDAREALGRAMGQPVTQEVFGALYGVTGQSVSDAERGASRPPKSSLERLAGILGIPVAAFEEGGPMPSTLPLRLAETRTPTGPPPVSVEYLRGLKARLEFLRTQIEAYRLMGARPSPEVLAEWLELTADLDDT